MAKNKYKLGWGEESKISSAIKGGFLDGGDLVITKDTKRLAFIDPHDENIIHFIKGKLVGFDSLEAAKSYASSDKSAYAGELISVSVNGKQKTYRLQSSESGFTLEDIESSTTGIKQYVKIVDSFPEVDKEEGIIYISGTTGKIWTGSSWKTIFEDISPVKEELSKKAPINNPNFTGVVTVDGDEVALKSYVEQIVTTLPSSSPGIVDAENSLPQTGYKAGQSWQVKTDGTYAGQSCKTGDMIICVNDFADAYSDEDFIVMQGRINGAVTGTDFSTDGDIVIFSGISGKSIKNSGINLSALEDLIAKSHEHTNKDILDSYTLTEEELLQSAEDTVYAVYEDIRNRLNLPEPYVEGNYLYANGHGLTIEAVDESTNKATYYLNGQMKELTFKVGDAVIGGAKDGNCHSSAIVMNSGNVSIIHGGSYGIGDVSEATIVVNGGTVEAIYGGGHPETNASDYANHTGHAKIVVNNVSGNPQIFGGGFSYAITGSAEIVVNDGNFTYVTAGGSNGYTGDSIIEINGGAVQCVQGVNRGNIGQAKITVNGGTVENMYAGVEPGEGATGSFGHTELHLLGGTVQNLGKGLNNNSADYSVGDYISGEYRNSAVNEDEAKALGLTTVTTVIHEDLITMKNEAVEESKAYVEASLSLVEF